MDGSEFGREAIESMQIALVEYLRKGEWFHGVNYEQRVKIGQGVLRALYGQLDMDRVMSLVKDRVEQRLADSIMNAMATETATDIKQIMCNTELREDLRSYLRSRMREAVARVEKPQG